MVKRFSILFYFMLLIIPTVLGCTSAVVGASLNPSGRPMLWKNRDTSASQNKIQYVAPEGEDFAFVALYNVADSMLNEAWMGMNEYGFAVMNTASYNLKDDSVPEKEMDKEGLIMTKALKKCKTIEDFAILLDTLPRPMGVEANFGVIDAYGNGAYFETNNKKYTRYNLKDSPEDIIVRTNYSHSGRDNEGFGFIREANANHLLEPYIAHKNVTPPVFTETLSRSFYHSLLDEDFSTKGDEWVIDQDFIPRFTSTASIVIEGCKPLKEGEEISKDYISDQYIMWTALGYPPCSETLPVWCKEDGVDASLQYDLSLGDTPHGIIVKERKNKVFPFSKGNGNKYIHMPVLFNPEGTGYVQTLVPANLATYKATIKERDK